MRIITISREFGSGGRELGKRLADALGIAYFDREIIAEIAEKTLLDADYIERTLDAGISIGTFPITYSRTFSLPHSVNTTASVLAQQHKIVRSLASRGDCVIVGRSADALLEEYHPLRLFVYADMPSKIARCRERANAGEDALTDRDYEKKCKQVDRARAANHDFISALKWGDMHGYDLCISTSGVSIKNIVPEIAAYIRARFEESGR